MNNNKNKIEVRDRYCVRYGENTFYSTIEAELERSRKIREQQGQQAERERREREIRRRKLEMLSLSIETGIF